MKLAKPLGILEQRVDLVDFGQGRRGFQIYVLGETGQRFAQTYLIPRGDGTHHLKVELPD